MHGFRNPAVLAKMAATLDAVSDGRLILGVGAGWHDPEFEAFGFPTDHKVGRFEEALTVITGLIRDGRADLEGEYVTVRDAVLVPPARPDIPILDRGQEAANVRADGAPRRRLEHGLVRAAGRAAGGRASQGLAEAMRAGRARPAEIAITVGLRGPLPGSRSRARRPSRAAPWRAARRSSPQGLAAHAALGADHVIVALDPNTPAALARFLEAVAVYRGAAARPA